VFSVSFSLLDRLERVEDFSDTAPRIWSVSLLRLVNLELEISENDQKP
jgi:hypothetical protein